MATEKKFKLKNGRELKVTYKYAEGLSKEERERRWNAVFDLLLKFMREDEAANSKSEKTISKTSTS